MIIREKLGEEQVRSNIGGKICLESYVSSGWKDEKPKIFRKGTVF